MAERQLLLPSLFPLPLPGASVKLCSCRSETDGFDDEETLGEGEKGWEEQVGVDADQNRSWSIEYTSWLKKLK
jgi:hypothetical protein